MTVSAKILVVGAQFSFVQKKLLINTENSYGRRAAAGEFSKSEMVFRKICFYFFEAFCHELNFSNF